MRPSLSLLLQVLLCTPAIATPAWTTPAWATDVEVRLLNVNGVAGSVRAQVCLKPDWLKDCVLAGRAPAKAGVSTVIVRNVPPGTYAVVAFHDANDNGDVDQNFIGLPIEGVGFSRDATIRFGAPSFESAALRIEGARVVVPITLHFEP